MFLFSKMNIRDVPRHQIVTLMTTLSFTSYTLRNSVMQTNWFQMQGWEVATQYKRDWLADSRTRAFNAANAKPLTGQYL
jgi:hypothetical protein